MIRCGTAAQRPRVGNVRGDVKDYTSNKRICSHFDGGECGVWVGLGAGGAQKKKKIICLPFV